MLYDLKLPKGKQTGLGYSTIQQAVRRQGAHDPAPASRSWCCSTTALVTGGDGAADPGAADYRRPRRSPGGKGITVPAKPTTGLMTEWL